MATSPRKQRRLRYRLTAVAAAASLLLGAVACSGSDNDTSDPDTIRIGILAPYSGVFADYGPKVIEDPIRLYLKEHDNKIAGKNVELFIADDRSEPDVELEKAQELVENKNVDVIIGLVNSAGVLAVRDYLHENKVLTMITVAVVKDVTQDLHSDYIFRVSFGAEQTEPAGAILAREAGLQKIAGIGADYVAGHQLLESLIDNFEQAGGEVVETLWSPLGTPDFSSYLTQLKRVAPDVDAIAPMMFGADALRFAQQYREFGFDTPLYFNGDVSEQTMFIDEVGENALGSLAYWYYSPYLDNPENKVFREAFLAAYDRLPGAFSMDAYASMQFLEAAASQVPDGLKDTDGVVQALKTTEIQSPAGPLRFDDGHALILTVYLNEIAEGPDGRIAQIPVGPYVTNVDQYQTLAEAEANLHR